MDIIIYIAIGLIGLLVGGGIAVAILNSALKKKRNKIVEEAEKEAENLKKAKLLQAKEKFLQLKEEHEKVIKDRERNIRSTQDKLKHREKVLSKQIEESKRKERKVDGVKQTLEKTALAIALSATNVYLRDTQHLLEVVLLAWFWMSAIAYNYGLVAEKLTERFGTNGEWYAALNPVLTVIITFQRTLYNPAEPTAAELADPNYVPILPPHPWTWYATHLSIALVGSMVLLYAALRLFSRLEDNFAEEI